MLDSTTQFDYYYYALQGYDNFTVRVRRGCPYFGQPHHKGLKLPSQVESNMDLARKIGYYPQTRLNASQAKVQATQMIVHK